MAVELQPTAEQVEYWLRNPEVWEITQPIRRRAEINSAVQEATRKIFARDYPKLYFTKERQLQGKTEDSQMKSYTDEVSKLTRRMMENIDNASGRQKESGLIKSEEYPFFIISPSLNKNMRQDEYYRLQTSGNWDNAVSRDFNEDKMIPPYVIAYRLAVLNLLGFRLDEDNQVVGEVFRKTLEQKSWFMDIGNTMVTFDISECRSPENPNVFLRIYKPQTLTDRFSVREMIVVKPFEV